ncbi:MAG: hypothetical protein V3R40_04345 [Gammaproteobacteria bacterium]
MSQFNVIYERFRPLIVWLGLAELAWIVYWLLRAGDAVPGYLTTVGVWIVVMLAWMVLVIFASTHGFFLKHTRWLSNLVGVVLVVAFAAVLFGAIGVAREGLLSAASRTTDLQLVSIHVLRLLAIGTVIKYIQGQLPLHFVIFGSVPDFLFAVSAVVVTILAANGPLQGDFLIVWHLFGFSLFLGAGISMFFSVPSPFRIYHDEPDASIVFQFPMVLAPNFTVPLFMLAHAFALTKLATG